jgi:hypothetical protein
MCGRSSLPRKGDSDSAPSVSLNDGVKLIAAVSGLEQAMEARMSVMRRLDNAQGKSAEKVESAERMVPKKMKGERIEALRMEIRDRRDARGACVLMTTPRD